VGGHKRLQPIKKGDENNHLQGQKVLHIGGEFYEYFCIAMASATCGVASSDKCPPQPYKRKTEN
jgi:hypothetical protein